MRKLGDQWIEIIDGKKHMLKAVEGEQCKGCAFGQMCKGSRLTDIHVCDREDDCPLEYANTVIKDLGVLNENDVLPCPFCGSYPELFTTFLRNASAIACTSCGCTSDDEYKSLQQAIDAWNRRA